MIRTPRSQNINFPDSSKNGCLFGKDASHGGANRAYPTKKSNILLSAALFELVENDCTNNDATLDNLLEIGRHIHQVENVV